MLRSLVQVLSIWGEWPKPLRFVGDDVPLVDIVVPCCNEPLDIIQDTVMGVLALDYPQDKYRLVVADDGASPEVEVGYQPELRETLLPCATPASPSRFQGGQPKPSHCIHGDSARGPSRVHRKPGCRYDPGEKDGCGPQCPIWCWIPGWAWCALRR